MLNLKIFLTGNFSGHPLLSAPEVPIDLDVAVHCRWLRMRQLIRSFWNKWSPEYLNTQTTKCKWQRPAENLKVGQIVVVPDVLTSPLSWPLSRIQTLHAGNDGIIRVASILCHGRTFKRSVNKLVLCLV